jgi:transposase InsO family protein
VLESVPTVAGARNPPWSDAGNDDGGPASPEPATLTGRARQSRERQEPARQAERERKTRVVEFAHWARARSWSAGEAAAVMGVPARTLWSWCRAWEIDGLEARPRGRPAVEVSVEQCGAVRSFLDCQGPIVGLPSLRSHYAHIPRVVLGEILGSFRDAWRHEHRRMICELEWTCPGATWAIDFTHPPRLVDGIFPAILNVVDLGSRQQLLWLPTLREDAPTVEDALGALFKQHGAPLVMKSDNGPAFRAAATKELLADWSVFPLFSPPYCASYNGVCERANRTMKLTTAHIAERADRSGWWRSEDLHEARLLANRMRRPWGAVGPSPEQKWTTRTPLSLDERQNVWQEIKRRRARFREARGIDLDVALPHYVQAEIDRDAASPVLAELGYYQVKRRRYTPAI